MRALKAIFSVCTSNAIKIHKVEKRDKELMRKMKEIRRHQGYEEPEGWEMEEDEAPPTFEDPFAAFEQDYGVHPLDPYGAGGSSHQGGASHQGGNNDDDDDDDEEEEDDGDDEDWRE